MKPLNERKNMAEDDEEEFTRVLYYSHPKVGKTTFAAHATSVADHVLWVEAEPGLKRKAMEQWDGVDLQRIIRIGTNEITFDNLQEIFGQVDDRCELGESWCIVIDTITNLQSLLLTQTVDERAKRDGAKRNMDPTKPELQDYGTNTEHLRRLMRQAVGTNCHLVVTAHVRDAVDPETKVPTGEMIPATTEKFGETLFGLVDVVMYVDNVKGTRTGFLVPTSERRAGDRYGLLPVVCPDPTFDRVHGYLTGAMTPKEDPVYREFRKANQPLIQKEERRAGITQETKE